MTLQQTLVEGPTTSVPTKPLLGARRASSLYSAVFLSMRIDNSQVRRSRRSVHRFTSEDLVPALQSSLSSNPAIPAPPMLGPAVEVQAMVRARVPTTTDGEFFAYAYHNNVDDKEHLAIVFGSDIRSRSLDAVHPGESQIDRIKRGALLDEPRSSVITNPTSETPSPPAVLPPPLVRIHSECLTGEILKSLRCDCGEQLNTALDLLQREGRGVILYLRQEGRGIGLIDKLKSYNLQDMGHDTVDANLLLNHPPDQRSYDVAVAMMKDLGLDNVRLLTNNPDKLEPLEEAGIKVERVGMTPQRWEIGNRDGEKEVDKYLKTKVVRMGYILSVPRELE